MIHFLVSYVHLVAFFVWVVFAVIILLRYYSVSYIARVPWGVLVVVAIALHLGYVALLGVAQYELWGASEFTKDFLTQPLAADVPLPWVLELVRHWFEGPLGYFSFYVLGRFALSLGILFIIALFCFILLKIRARYRPRNFKEGDIPALTLAVLVSGWPGVVVLLPLGFIFALIISLGVKIMYGVDRIYLPPAFLVAAPIAFIFSEEILKLVNLYTVLKL